MMLPPKVSRSTMAAQSRGSVSYASASSSTRDAMRACPIGNAIASVCGQESQADREAEPERAT